MKRQDVLYAWREERLVGTLWRGQGERLIGFEYDQAWRDTGHAISFSLPLEQQTWLPEDQRAHRWFGNLLPEEQARRHCSSGWRSPTSTSRCWRPSAATVRVP